MNTCNSSDTSFLFVCWFDGHLARGCSLGRLCLAPCLTCTGTSSVAGLYSHDETRKGIERKSSIDRQKKKNHFCELINVIFVLYVSQEWPIAVRAFKGNNFCVKLYLKTLKINHLKQSVPLQ